MSIKNKIIEYYSSQEWNIGFITSDISDILAGSIPTVKWMKHSYKDRWFADPFILEINEEHIIVLVEEYLLKNKKAQISKLIIKKDNFVLQDIIPIIVSDTHLSFPAYYREGDRVYIYPENSASSGLVVYTFNKDCTKLISQKRIIDNPLTDSVFTPDDRKYMFTTAVPKQNENELQIYEYDEMKEKYNYLTTYNFTKKIARNGGLTFKYNNELYRVAQECEINYGYAIIIQKIKNLDNLKTIDFKDIVRLAPFDKIYNRGFHTFNLFKENFIVCDGNKFVHHFLYNNIILIHSAIKCLFNK